MAQTWHSSLNLDVSSPQWEQMYDLYSDRLLKAGIVTDAVSILFEYWALPNGHV